MRVIRNISQRLLGLAPLALIPVAVLAAGQTTPPAPKSFAGSHSIVVIGPNSPLFDSLLQKDFPGVDQVNYFQQIKPLLAIIHNNTLREIKAYVAQWAITSPDGSISTALLTVTDEASAEWSLLGERAVLGPAGTQLISPFFHWDKARVPGFLIANVVSGSFEVAATQEELTKAVKAGAGVVASLDGAIFGDGEFVGPDKSKLYERYAAEQSAQADEGAWMLNQLNGGSTDQQLRDDLSQQIYAGRNSSGTDPSSLYTAARGREATRLLAILDENGQSGLLTIATRMAHAKTLSLQQVATP